MRICWFGIYSRRPVYPRNNNLIRALRSVGVEVRECRETLAESFAGRSAAARTFPGLLRFLGGLARTWVLLSVRLLRMPPPDLFVVGHPGYFHLHLLRFLRGLLFPGVPVVYDVFIPLHDTLVRDRRYLRERGLPARLLRLFEQSVCRNADLCLIDTRTHARFLHREFGIPFRRLAHVFVGADPAIFPRTPPPPARGPMTVLQCSTFIPLHGLSTVVRAAKLLEDEPGVCFVIVGGGQTEQEIRGLAASLGVRNLEFRPFRPVRELHREIAAAHVCLGVFGTSGKAGRVIPTKAFDTLSVGRPLVSADTPAMREAFTDGENALLVPPGDPEALAAAIRRLRDDPALRRRLAEEGARLFDERFSDRALGERFLSAVEPLLRGRGPRRQRPPRASR